MNILHLDPDDIDNPLSGGGPVRTLEIYRRMAARHRITVLTPTFPGSTPECERDGIRYVRLGRRIGDHGSSHHLSFLAALPAAVRRFDHDLLVEDTMPPCSTTWTPWFARRSRPLIASVQWWMAEHYTQQLKLPFHWGQTYGVRWYRHFVVLTEQMRRTIGERHPGAHCEVIPNGVDSVIFGQPLLDVGRPRTDLLYLGRIEIHAKGLDLLMEALSRIAPARRPRLRLAGRGPAAEEARLDHMIEVFGLAPWVERLGHVDAVARARLLLECRLLVMPSRAETFGMTIAEANAAGRLALIFDRWPMNEVAAPLSPRVRAFDVPAYARAIEQWCATPDDQLMALGETCRRWAERFDWDTVSARQEAYYDRVLSGHSRGRQAA